MAKVTNLNDFFLDKNEVRRPLDWRHRRAIQLSRGDTQRIRLRNSDDELVGRYARMLRALYHHESTYEFDRIKTIHKDIFRAYAIYANCNPTELALLDGFLLSSAIDPLRVEKVFGLKEDQQRLYRNLYMDLDGRKDMSMIIVPQLLEPDRLNHNLINLARATNENPAISADTMTRRGSLRSSVNSLLRIIGYYAGPVVLEMMYSGMIRGTFPEGPDSAQRWLNEVLLTGFRRQGVIAANTTEFVGKDLMAFLQLAFRLAREEKTEGQVDIIMSLEALVRQLPPRIGDAKAIYQATAIPVEAMDGAFELDPDELAFAASTGNIPDNIQALTTQMNKQIKERFHG